MALDNLKDKLSAFGWQVVDAMDGNSIEELTAAFETARKTKGAPTAIIAHTVKGRGSSVMENKASWHHHVPNPEELSQIRRDLLQRKEACAS